MTQINIKNKARIKEKSEMLSLSTTAAVRFAYRETSVRSPPLMLRLRIPTGVLAVLKPQPSFLFWPFSDVGEFLSRAFF